MSGFAVAGGLELSIWCDLRVVEEDAVFGVFCRRWGVPLIDGGTWRLSKLIGRSRALDMVLTGRSVDAKEALLFGLANKVVKKGDCVLEALKLARLVSSFPQVCMRNDRSSVYEVEDKSLEEALRVEWNYGQNSLIHAPKNVQLFRDGEGRGGKWKSKL